MSANQEIHVCIHDRLACVTHAGIVHRKDHSFERCSLNATHGHRAKNGFLDAGRERDTDVLCIRLFQRYTLEEIYRYNKGTIIIPLYRYIMVYVQLGQTHIDA